VLTVDPRGGPVDGQLLHLRAGTALGHAIDVLAAREGIPGAEGILAVRSDRDGVVLTCALPRNLADAEMSPVAHARRAAASMANGALNGVAYLRDAVGAGVRTPLTARYIGELVDLAGCAGLQEVEARLVALREREMPKE
jgi:hypothetical protein